MKDNAWVRNLKQLEDMLMSSTFPETLSPKGYDGS